MSRPRILLADDDRRVRQLVGLTLAPDEYELCFAEDGADALRLALELTPSLILLDFAMPGVDGVEVCAALRSEPATAATPIVMLTGHGDDEVRERAIVAGVNGFLTKPFSPLALEQTIRALVVGSGLPTATPTPRPAIVPAGLPRPAPGSARNGAAAGARPSEGRASRGDRARRAPTAAVARQLAIARELEDARRRYADLRDTFFSTIEALASALELRAAETEGHCQRVTLYALAAARHLGVGGEELEQLHWGALLHDVGMISVPDVILLKPGALRPEEWALIRLHPEQGARLLQHIPGLGSALAVVRFHHERFDGAGYPLGVRGTAIPLGARIVAVADALDAITTDRPYRPARSWEEARVEILQGRGSHFDPSVVDAFLEIFDDLHGLTGVERPLPPSS